MKSVRNAFVVFVVILMLVGSVYAFFGFYPYIFARHVNGVIERVERVQVNVSLMQNSPTGKMSSDLFSFAVAIKEKSGEIVTASSEDRQWAVAQSGQCAEAKYYPYPPWHLDKSGTYYGARLLKLSVCPGESTEENTSTK